MTPKRVVLIDGKNLLFRHNAVNGNLSRGDGFPTGALHGCLNTMIALARHLPDTPFVWVWDGDGETWRHRYMRENSYLYQPHREASTREPTIHKKVIGYKANRIPKKKENLEKIKSSKYPEDGKARGLIQIPVLRMVLDGAGFRNFQIPTLEGDDLIAIITRYIVKHTDMECIIHSGDKDFYQLMGDKVKILSRIENGKPKFVHRRNVAKDYNVSVRDWAKYRAWTGDKSDNIPHIPSVGPGAASKMIAAGLDPSLPLNEISERVARKFTRYFKPDGITQYWPFAQSNYKLCKLVSRHNDSRLPKDIQQSVKQLLRHLKFTRSKSKLTNEAYRRVSHALMRYELKSVISRRDLLWRIP